jgi:hypothetical protein
MSDATERPEDTVRRFALQIQELEAWKAKYREAAELWEALEAKDSQQVTEAMLIAKLVDFEETGPAGTVVSASHTDGCDWVNQLGLVAAWQLITNSDGVEKS